MKAQALVELQQAAKDYARPAAILVTSETQTV